MRTWSLQDAKARFSEVVNRAQGEGPQMVSRRGKETAVVLSIEDYRAMAKPKKKQSLVELLRNSPLVGLPEDLFERDKDPGRDIEL